MPAKIIGMEKLFADLDAFGMNIPKALAKAGKYAMSMGVEGPAKKMCPVVTGRLRASIHTRAWMHPQGATIKTGTDVFYGVFVHDGHEIRVGHGSLRKDSVMAKYAGGISASRGRTTGQPFLATALELNQARIPDLIAQSLRQQIDAAVAQKRLAGIGEYLGGLE